eukprot:GFUD01020383.1.p1 GENE.GFUD01020383.1~~GFUD01020383.1.p1  ORF type:complete len:133 (+),score=34.16 GFUD01020383.1:47-400(+)
MRIYLLLCFSALLLPHCLGGDALKLIMEAPEWEEECGGPLTLYDNGGTKTVVTKDENEMKVRVDKVKFEGNCCFTLHSLKRGRGRTYYLLRRGEHSAEEIGWSRVRSVRRVECDILA